jgi:CubicO group peptidase (beta-lactamase class C family)
MKLNLTLFAILFISLIANAQYNFEKLTNWQEENTPALGGRSILMIYTNGKIVFSNAENEMSRKQKITTRIIARKQGKNGKEMIKDFSEYSVMPIASCSKWLSAALVMTFVDEGKLALTDTVGKFLPILAKNGKGNITIAQCLSHTTGINAGDLKESIKQFKKASNMEDAMQIIATLPMDTKPGESFRYSNVGLQIAGAVIEKIANKDYETLFKERIAVPCAMTKTNFGNKKLPIPAGSAESTASDYLQFLIMILQNGMYDGKQILKKESVAAMQKSFSAGKEIKYSPEEAGKWTYGFGQWMMEEVKYNEKSNSVTSPGLFGTFPWVDNKNKYAAILFTFNIKSKGRLEKYTELKTLVDAAISN